MMCLDVDEFGSPMQPHTPLSLKGLVIEEGVAARVLNVQRMPRAMIMHDPGDVIYIGRDASSYQLPVWAGRGGAWGNPFKLEYESELGRARCLLRYFDHLFDLMYKSDHVRRQVYALRDKRLLCWCSPSLCHGHILATLSQLSDEEKSVTGVEGDVTMPEWEVAADLMRLHLAASLKERHYTAERIHGSERNSAGFPKNTIKFCNSYTAREGALESPERIQTKYTVEGDRSWHKDNLWETLRVFAEKVEQSKVSLWVDGEERGWVRLRVADGQDRFVGKILLEPFYGGELLVDLVKFLTHH